MTHPRLALPFLCLAALPACVVPIPIPLGTFPVGEEDTCGAGGLQSFVGQDASVLLATTFTAPIRIIRPGDAVTQDFQPQRVNFDVGADGRVTGVRCG